MVHGFKNDVSMKVQVVGVVVVVFWGGGVQRVIAPHSYGE